MFFSLYHWIMYLISLPLMILGLILMNKKYFYSFDVTIHDLISVTNLSFTFIVDYISCIFSASVLVISSSVFLYSKSYMSSEKSKNLFMIVLFLFVVSMVMLIFSNNLLFSILGWDGLGVTSFILILYYSSSVSLQSGILTYLCNRVGDCFLLMSIFYLICNTLMSEDYNLIPSMSTLGSLFLIITTLTKSAQFPFSSWLPAAMAAPTPVSSLVHSSTLVTAGIYLLIRFFPVWTKENSINMMLLILSLTTLMLASTSAMAEDDMKKVIALSTLSQLGFIFFMLSIGLPGQAFFHLLCHAFFKALLFLLAGIFIHGDNGEQSVRHVSVCLKSNPNSLLLLSVSAITLSGFPFLSAFYSKEFLIEKLFDSNWMIVSCFIVCFSISLTIFYSLRMIKMLTNISLSWTSNNDQSNEQMMKPCYVLFLLACSFGSVGYWLMFSEEVFVSSFSEKLMVYLILTLSACIAWNITWFPVFMEKFLGNMWDLPFLTKTLFWFSGTSLSKIISKVETYGMMKLPGDMVTYYTKAVNPMMMELKFISNNSLLELSIVVFLIIYILWG